MIDIRVATIDDIAGILPLMSQLGYPCSDHEIRRRFKKFTSNDGYGILIALDNKIVVGNTYRGKGVGKKLMFGLEENAKSSSPVIIDLTSGVRREKDGTTLSLF